MVATVSADNGSVSGSAGIKLSSDSSGVLALQSGANTTAVTIDTSQNVGIGGTPAQKLDVIGSASRTRWNTSNAYVYQVISNPADSAYATNRVDAASHDWYVSNSAKMTLDSSGNVGIGTSSPSTLLDLAKSNTSGNDNQMPNVFVRNTSATQGNGSSTFNQAIAGVSAGNGTVSGGIRAAYDSAGSYGTGVQLYVNSTNPLQFYTNGSERARIDSSGNLLVGTSVINNANGFSIAPSTAPYVTLNKSASGTKDAFYFEYNGAIVGKITYSDTATAYNTSSDYRLKENIAPMTGALDTVAKLKPVTYKWKIDGSNGQGFIAHELQAVVPDCVSGEKDAVDADGNPVYQGIDTSFLVATLTAAIQEQQALITAQAETINALTARVVALEGA